VCRRDQSPNTIAGKYCNFVLHRNSECDVTAAGGQFRLVAALQGQQRITVHSRGLLANAAKFWWREPFD
jgi:hypothetical protein